MSINHYNQPNRTNFTDETLEQLSTSQPTPAELASPTQQPPTLSQHIEHSVRQYFSELDTADVTDVYDLMLQQFERPLLTVIYELTKGNQTHMAEILGLNRGTLRKKLKRYDFIK